jgi:hypothetical protein
MRRTKAVEAVVAKPYWREDDALLVVEAWRRSGVPAGSAGVLARQPLGRVSIPNTCALPRPLQHLGAAGE